MPSNIALSSHALQKIETRDCMWTDQELEKWLYTLRLLEEPNEFSYVFAKSF